MRLLRLRHFLISACALAALTASPAAAITGGQPDGSAHPYVAFVGDPRPDANGNRPSCSGFFIDATTVVTAAHCFVDPPVLLVFPDGPRVSGPIPATWHPDPLFCGACAGGLVGFATHDIAIVKLMAPVSLPRYAQLPELGATDALGNQAQVTMVGYGAQGFALFEDPDEDPPVQGPPKPFRDFMRTTATGELGNPGTKLAEQFLKVKLNQGGFCLGDSGGPVLQGDTVLAINSFVTNDRCAGVGYSYRLDTPAAQSFIAATR